MTVGDARGDTPYVSWMAVIQPVSWSHDTAAVRILDQRELPAREVYRDLRTVDDVREAIVTLAVRGAPAIGIAGAMGIALALDGSETDREAALMRVVRAHGRIKSARPTAVNLGWAVDRVVGVAMRGNTTGRALRDAIVREATAILD